MLAEQATASNAIVTQLRKTSLSKEAREVAEIQLQRWVLLHTRFVEECSFDRRSHLSAGFELCSLSSNMTPFLKAPDCICLGLVLILHSFHTRSRAIMLNCEHSQRLEPHFPLLLLLRRCLQTQAHESPYAESPYAERPCEGPPSLP